MNKLKFDPIEQTFSRLKNLEEYTDDAVWEGVSAALDKKEKGEKRAAIWFLSLGVIFISSLWIWLIWPTKMTTDTAAAASVVKIAETPKPAEQMPFNTEKNFNLNNNLNRLGAEENSYMPAAVKGISSNQSSSLMPLQQSLQAAYPLATEVGGEVNIYSLGIKNERLLFAQVLPEYNIQSIFHPLVDSVSRLSANSIDFYLGSGAMLQPQKAFIANGGNAAVGLNFNHPVNRKIKLTIGLSSEFYQLHGVNYSDQPLRFIRDSVLAINRKREIFYYKYYDTAVFTTTTAMKVKTAQFTLPLGLQYHILDKKMWSVDVKLEAVLGFAIERAREYNTTRGTKYMAAQYVSISQFVKPINCRLGMGMRFNYKEFRNNSMFISPNMYYVPNAMRNNVTGQSWSPVILNIQVGISKKI